MKKLLLLSAIFTYQTLVAQNVGIGTAAPLGKLHISTGASGNITPFSPLVVEGNNNTYINLLSPNNYETGLLFGKADNAASGAIVYNNVNNLNGFQFRTNGNVTQMILNNAGNLGIGFSTPNAKLSISVDGTELVGTATGNTLRTNAGSLGSTAGSELSLANIGFLSSNNSSLGIRAYRSSAGSDWTTTSLLLGYDVDNTVRAGGGLIAISANGNIGIGVFTPAEKLHVTGNLKADTVKPNAIKLTPNAGTGKVLTSDAAGNANWQAISAAGGVGFGSWGDCSTNSISEYNPVADAYGVAGDAFGISVSISGNYAIVGANEDDGIAGIDQGSASIYQYLAGNWVLMQKLTDADGALGDRFGISASISGNYAIVGAYRDDGVAGADQGSASIYQWNGSSWVLMQKLIDATGAATDYFGYSVSISGNYAIVGANFDDGSAGADQGSASIYQYLAGNWELMQKLTDATGAAGDRFGISVSISGNNAIVGAFSDDGVAGANQGSASIYWYNSPNWDLLQKLTDASGAANDNFGISVSISGNYAIVGAYLDDEVAGADQGSASIYQWNGTSWVLMQKLIDATGAATDYFGCNVSISGNYVIVGAYEDDGVAGSAQGSASIYLRVGLGWQKLQKITDPGGNSFDFFGYATAIDGTTQRFLIGAYPYANFSGKVVFGKVN